MLKKMLHQTLELMKVVKYLYHECLTEYIDRDTEMQVSPAST